MRTTSETASHLRRWERWSVIEQRILMLLYAVAFGAAAWQVAQWMGAL